MWSETNFGAFVPNSPTLTNGHDNRNLIVVQNFCRYNCRFFMVECRINKRKPYACIVPFVLLFFMRSHQTYAI